MKPATMGRLDRSACDRFVAVNPPTWRSERARKALRDGLRRLDLGSIRAVIARHLRDMLHAEPFRPFIVRATSGRRYRVADPSLAVLMRSAVFIAQPRSDRAATVPYLHIAAVEAGERR